MKRRFVMVIAIVMVAIAMIMLLGGCGEKVANPSDFMGKWYKTDKKSCYDGSGNEYYYNGNRVLFIYRDIENKYETQIIYEVLEDRYNIYTGTSEGIEEYEWTAESISFKDYEEMNEEEFDIRKLFARDCCPREIKELIEPISEEILLSLFEEKEGWYTAVTEIYDYVSIKVTEEELYVRLNNTATDEYDYKFVLDSKEIFIPDAAKETLKDKQANQCYIKN